MPRLEPCNGHHLAGLLSGLGVHEEVLHEYLRSSSGRSAVLGLVSSLDVNLCSFDSERASDYCSLAVGAGDTVALRSLCAYDQTEVCGSCRDLLEFEGELLGGEGDDSLAR